MKKTLLLLFAVSLAQAGELYRWVDAHGAVFYSDQPPPPSARQVQQFKGKANVVEVDRESYALKQAQRLSPVTLYATACGPVCEEATEFLKRRGVPYTQKDPSQTPEIATELKKLSGGLEVPVIVVGTSPIKGYTASAWGRLLDAANYPKTGEAR